MQSKLFRPLAAAAFVALASLAGAAQARDNVFFSLGVQAAPGVSVGVSNVAPVYMAPQPVYVAPQPVYVEQPVYVAPRPIVVAPAAVYYGPGRRVGWHRHHGHRHWD
jgi:hypothetical protein